MKARLEKRRELKTQLLRVTGCRIQHTGWPCNTCFHGLRLRGVSKRDLHMMWQATLVLRGDYRHGKGGMFMPPVLLEDTILRLLEKLSATKSLRLPHKHFETMPVISTFEKTGKVSPNPERAADGSKEWKVRLACGHEAFHYSKIRPSWLEMECLTCRKHWFRATAQ